MIAPAGEYVLIKPIESKGVLANGLLIEVVRQVPCEGHIVAVSPDLETVLREGDQVRYLPNHRIEVEDGHILLKEDNILFKFNA